MSIRIKTLSNDIAGDRASKDHHHSYQAAKASNDSGQVNKILELEWEALGRKLKKQIGGAPGDEVEKLRKQVKEKDEKLRHAEHKIAELKKQLSALQDKQRMSKPHAASRGGYERQHKPVHAQKDIAGHDRPKPQFQGGQGNDRSRGRK
jgi:uncharacterized coiled-coil DUF342 family protein